MRKLPALLAAPALVVTLAACTSGSSAAIDGCTPPFGSGGASSLVEAPGDFGSSPEAEFPTPLISEGSQVSRLIEGEGEPIREGSQVDFDATIYLGEDGSTLEETAYDGESLVRRPADDASDLNRALQCARPGERLALTTSVADGLAEGAYSSGGIEDDATIVIVVDVVASYLGKAEGVNQLPEDGMPTVVTAVDGTPGITVPAEEPPAEARTSTIKAGDGAVVEEGDTVVAHFSAFTWPAPGGTPTVSESSWDAGVAVNFSMSEEELVPGLVEALVGAKIGSQVLAVLPPAEGSEDGQTRIFVVDVLGIVE